MIFHKYNQDIRIKAWFPRLNKQDKIEDYEWQTNRTQEDCKVTHVAILSNEGYDEFTDNLLTDREWLAGLGGHDADGDNWPEGSWYKWPEAEQERFKRACYCCVVEVQSPEMGTIYINPEGYDYARYVAFPF
jgi:hypothetical protein